MFFFFKQKTEYEMRISDWSSDVCSSDLPNGDVLWVKAPAWLITLGLIFAILPRLINLFHVWRLSNRSSFVEKSDFWLNLVAIAAGIINAFVHSRDAYGSMPEEIGRASCRERVCQYV